VGANYPGLDYNKKVKIRIRATVVAKRLGGSFVAELGFGEEPGAEPFELEGAGAGTK
jgi:hypothetical protein